MNKQRLEKLSILPGMVRHAPGPVGGAPFPVDMDRVLGDLNSTFNPLHQDFMLDFHVSGAHDGYVYLSIALPEGMTRVFVSFLESMSGFFRFIDVKARSAFAQGKTVDPAEVEKRERLQTDFRQECCSLFNGIISQGQTVKDAAKNTNHALKVKNHVWATYEVVASVLRSAGRFRKVR
jgi:hypothetical protein